MSVEPVDSLEAELRALSAGLDFPATPDLAAAVAMQLHAGPNGARRSPRWWHSPRTAAIAAGIVSLLAVILVLSPGARDAVASVFRGVRGIRIVVDRRGLQPTPQPPLSLSAPVAASSPAATAAQSPSAVAPESPSARTSGPAPRAGVAAAIPGTPTTLTAVRRTVAFTPLVPAALGAPDRVLLDKEIANGMVTMVWKVRPGLPRAAGDIGAVLTQFKPDLNDDFPYWQKTVVSEGALRYAKVGGSDATWVEGGHRLDFQIPDSVGWVKVSSSRIAANTLVWARNGVTLRLETALSLADALAIAESLK